MKVFNIRKKGSMFFVRFTYFNVILSIFKD